MFAIDTDVPSHHIMGTVFISCILISFNVKNMRITDLLSFLHGLQHTSNSILNRLSATLVCSERVVVIGYKINIIRNED